MRSRRIRNWTTVSAAPSRGEATLASIAVVACLLLAGCSANHAGPVPRTDPATTINAEANKERGIEKEARGILANPTDVAFVTAAAKETARVIRALKSERDVALDAVPHARTDWDDAQAIRTDDALFTSSAAALRAFVGLTDEQFDALAP